MSSDSGVHIIAVRPRKRARREPLPHDQSWRQTGESSSSTAHASFSPHRYPGDGLDFRRPVTSSALPEDEIIDLTDDPDPSDLPRRQTPDESWSGSRQPARDIMPEVVDLEDEENTGPPSSPEVQFVSASVRQPPPQPPRTQHITTSNLWRMLQIPHTELFASSPATREVPWRPSRFTHADLETIFLGDRAAAIDLTINVDVNDPFHVEYPGTTPDRGRGETSYKPPSPAPEGFTRSVGEDDIATCPNCEAELGIGNEIKQQTWVAKQCGHLYCGECATNRSLSKAKKSTSRTKPFAKCQVPDCGKPISAPRSMFQVYL